MSKSRDVQTVTDCTLSDHSSIQQQHFEKVDVHKLEVRQEVHHHHLHIHLKDGSEYTITTSPDTKVHISPAPKQKTKKEIEEESKLKIVEKFAQTVFEENQKKIKEQSEHSEWLARREKEKAKLKISEKFTQTMIEENLKKLRVSRRQSERSDRLEHREVDVTGIKPFGSDIFSERGRRALKSLSDKQKPRTLECCTNEL